MLTNQEIGQRIRARRKELDLTLQEVADAVGIRNSTVLRYEQGAIKRLKQPVIESIADALHTTPEYLMGWTDDPINYDDGDLIAEIPLSDREACDGDVKRAYAMMRAVDEAWADGDSPPKSSQPATPTGDELTDAIILGRDGKAIKRTYTKEQMEALRKIIDVMPYLDDEEL